MCKKFAVITKLLKWVKVSNSRGSFNSSNSGALTFALNNCPVFAAREADVVIAAVVPVV